MDNLGFLQNGLPVADRYNSHLHNGIRDLLPVALAKIDPNDQHFVKEVVDFGEVIGEKTCVETSSSDEIIFAQRPKRSGLSRFVKGRQPEPCSRLVVLLIKARDFDGYVLVSAFIGDLSEHEPWDPKADPEKSRGFWNNHALIWGSEEIISSTETAKCPW